MSFQDDAERVEIQAHQERIRRGIYPPSTYHGRDEDFTDLPDEGAMTQAQLNLFYAILNTKNSWGKNEIRAVLLEVVAGVRTEV